MGLRINSNIAALSSYNNLNKTDKAVSSSLEKLSSGYRINRAADDAAGLVVSEGLKSQIGGLTVAARNAQDGVNVAQTADGALSTVTDILQRMRDLAVQASNSGSQDATAQSAANTEFGQLKSELDRISSTTQFGGQQLLSGSYNGQFQVGAFNTANDRIGINLTSGGLFSGATAATDNAVWTATDTTFLDTDAAALAGKTISVAGVSVTLASTTAAVSGSSTTGLVQQVNAALDAAYGAGKVVMAGNGTTTLTVTVPQDANSSGLASISVSGIPGATVAATLDGVTGFSQSALGLTNVSVGNTALAQNAIDFVDKALAGVSNARASIGAVQNRFEKTIDNLNTAIQNITASNSAIRDTDMAAEMTKFTKNQVLAQAGTSMLAQANSSTQNILTLLRG